MKQLGYLVLIVVFFAVSFLFPHTTYAYVDSMAYQGTITINNSSNSATLSNYQVKVRIDTATLISAGRMKSDCSDIRFTDSDGTTKLSYWQESSSADSLNSGTATTSCNQSGTIFWVKVPSISGSSSKTIYTYFGNNSASSESSGSSTFNFFDDFSTLNSSTWTSTNSPTATISAGILNVTAGAVYSNSTLASQQNTIVESRIAWANFVAHAGMEIGNRTDTASSNSNSARVAYFFSPDSGAVASAGDGTSASYNVVSSQQLHVPNTSTCLPSTTAWGLVANTYYVGGMGVSGNKLYYYKDYCVADSFNTSNWTGTYYLWFGYFRGSASTNTNGSDVFVDWTRIRNFSYPEPSISATVGISPSKPQNFMVTGGNAQALLTWDAPSTGSGITDYVVQYSTDGSNFSTFSDGVSTSTTATITGLSNGTTYTFRVYAINSYGNGANSDTMTATPVSSTLHGILLTGQSHAIGYNGCPAISTSQPYENLKLNTAYTKLKQLIEDVDVSDDCSGANESPMSGMANTITTLSSGHSFQSVVLNNAVGGYAYSQLKQGTTPYNNGLTYITTANTIAGTLSRTFKVDAVANMHGPADRSHPELYEGYLEEWQRNYDTDIKAITGQSADIPMFIDQSSNFSTYGVGPDIPVAQLKATEDYPTRIYMVAPKYMLHFLSSDWVHMTPASYQLLGDYYGKAIKRVLVDGQSIVALTPAEEVRKGNVITVRFNVPVTPLAWDTTNVLSKTNYGFEFYDDSGATPAISSVALQGQDAVRITLASTPTGATQKIRYAYSGTVSQPGADQSGAPRGNLRDSDTTQGSANTNLYNWAVHFDKDVTADNTAPTQSGMSLSVASTSASLSWSTSENSSETFSYGLTTSYGQSSTLDSYPRATSHSINLSNLTACTQYHYQIVSTDLAGNQGTATDTTFTTSGCTGSASVIATQTNDVTDASGGSLSLLSAGKGLALTIPAGSAGADANFQIKQLDTTATLSTTATPSGNLLVGNYLYDLKALSDPSTKISSFNHPLTVTLSYGSADVVGVDESTLKIYRWDDASWHELSSCTVDTTAKTVSCTTTAFSVFGLFYSGTITPTPSPSPSTNNSGSSSSTTSDQKHDTGCSDQKPLGIPTLFQVNRQGKTATLFVTPSNNPYSGFGVKYGPVSSPELYTASFNFSSLSGVATLVIGDLDKNTNYSFKVKALNGCNSGEWGTAIIVNKGNTKKQSYYLSKVPLVTQTIIRNLQVLGRNNKAASSNSVKTTTSPLLKTTMDAPTSAPSQNTAPSSLQNGDNSTNQEQSSWWKKITNTLKWW